MRPVAKAFAVTALLTTALVAPGAVSSGTDAGGHEATVADAMRAAGFRVNPGYPLVWSLDPSGTCRDYTYPALQSCLGANPAAPYVIAAVKAWPGEYVDKTVVNAFGQVRPGYEPTYRLHRREAIVFYGKMPPPGRYMGIQTWQWSQPGRWKPKDHRQVAQLPNLPFPLHLLFSTMPPGQPRARRVFSFSGLGDPVNNVVMQQRSGSPFDKHRYFVITPSATTDQAIRQVLQARGVPDSHIFTEQIPRRDNSGRIGPLGMGRNAIDFNTWLRYAVPDPAVATAAQQWRSHPPVKVLRVIVPASHGAVRRYGDLTFEKTRAHSERYLAGDQQTLVRTVCHRMKTGTRLRSADCTQPTPTSALMVNPLRDYGWDGPYCRSIHMNCDGDNPDTAFFYAEPAPLDSGQVYAVVGTLATQTGNATYVGLSAHDASTFYAPINILDTDLKGSAGSYAHKVQHTGKFFVHYFTRDCAPLEDVPGGAKNCTAITDAMIPKHGDSTAFGDPALRGMLQLGIRDYIVPGTQRGPDAAKMLTPVVLAFTKG